MNVLIVTDKHDSFINCTDNQNDDINFFVKDSLLSTPSNISLLSLIGLINFSMNKSLMNGQYFIPNSSP